MHTLNAVRVSFVRSTSLRRFALAALAGVSLSASTARAAGFNAQLQGQSFGSTNWSSANVQGWQELDLIPMRVFMTGGPVSAKVITVQFDHTKMQGGRTLQGIQNLYSFTPSANVVITSGPTLNAPPSQDIWTYTFTVNLTSNASGFVEFRARVAAGAHEFVGASLNLGGTPSLGNISIIKPAPGTGSPDLTIVKLGPANANPGQTINYSISYSNKISGTTAVGVQIADTLPNEVTFVSCTGGCEALGNTVTWTPGDLPRGARGVITYQVQITNVVTTGFSFHNDASIASSQNDANPTDNFSSVTTIVTSNCIPPSIVTAPSDAAVCEGEPVALSVAANGSAPLFYQWRKDGVDINGATSDTLTLNSTVLTDSGSYDVVVSNLCGTTGSTAAALVVGGAIISSQPSDASVCIGDSAAFNVVASGDALIYQWRKDGADISGATNSLFEIASTTEQDAGGYDVVITSTCGGTTSTVASLTLNLPAAITTDPIGATVCEGDAVLLSVGASGSSLLYQWRKDGNDVIGATSSSLSISAAAEADAGSYDVVVTSACGSPVISASATVVVNLAPSITQGPVDTTVTAGDPLTLSVTATGSGLTYQWRKDGNDIAGATDSTFSIAATTQSDAGSYDVVVSGTCGSAAVSGAVTVTVNPPSNHVPVAVDDSYETSEDTALTVAVAGVLANDSDADGDNLSASVVDGPSHGVLTLNANGSFTYTPIANFHGTDSFTYVANDGTVDSALATVTITVDSVNDLPVAVDDSLTIAEDSGTHAIDALANDSDVDGDALTITGTTAASNGSVAITGGGTGLSYTPNANFNGSDSFTYTISDGNGGTATATVNVTVIAVADAPVAQDDSYEVSEDDTLIVAASGVLANDINVDGGVLTALLVSNPAHGSVTLNANGSFTYVPDDNYNGADGFTYKANNGTLDSNVATVHINVLAVSGAGDIDLYVKTASAKIDWKSHSSGSNRDGFSLRGQINPRGIKDDLSGATIAVSINGVQVLAPQTLDARGTAASASGSTKIKCRLKNSNGAYSIKVSDIDLRAALGLANANQVGMTTPTIRLTINGANLDVPTMTAEIESPFRTSADKSTALKFSFRKNRTMSGAFNCNKTACSSSSKGETASVRGAVESEGGEPIVPNGNIIVHIGDAVATVPFASLMSSGAGATSAFVYAAPKGTLGVTKFSLSNVTHSFTLTVVSADIGMSAVTVGSSLKHDLPLLIEVPTADGPMFFESIIELKRSSETSTHWKR